MRIFTLKKRKYFVQAANGYKAVANGIVIQAAFCLPEQKADDETCFIGFTATKKLGKAHIRNSTKRRLRALAQIIMPSNAKAKINYIFIGRHNTCKLDFSYLCRKAITALQELHSQMFDSKGADNAPENNDCGN